MPQGVRVRVPSWAPSINKKVVRNFFIIIAPGTTDEGTRTRHLRVRRSEAKMGQFEEWSPTDWIARSTNPCRWAPSNYKNFIRHGPRAASPQLFASSLNPTRTRLHRLAAAQSKRWESTWCLTIKRATAVFPVAHQYRLSFPPLPQSAAFPISELRNVSCAIPMQFYAILMLYSFPACPILSRKSLSRVRPQHVVISSPLPSLPLRVLS